jgi:hypothetical protein
MIIDIEPHIVREADALEQIMMETYGYNELYYFKRDNGEESVKWCAFILLDFCPQYTVSEWIELDALNGISTWTHAVKCWNKGIHPTWTRGEAYRKWEEDVALSLSDQRVQETAKYIIKSAKKKIDNPWKFIMIKKIEIPVGSVWITKHSWGDVDGIVVTHDEDKKTFFTVIRVENNMVYYHIQYDGHLTPQKEYSCSVEEFRTDLKRMK